MFYLINKFFFQEVKVERCLFIINDLGHLVAKIRIVNLVLNRNSITMKTILYATDYSENSELALKYAYNMSIKIEAKLWVIHVFDYPTFFDDITLNPEAVFPDIEGNAFKIHHSKLHAFCNRVLKKDIGALNIAIESIEDKSVVNAIIEKANAVDAFLIVTGMKGTSKLRELIMGSIAK